jgi:hypothetical protein
MPVRHAESDCCECIATDAATLTIDLYTKDSETSGDGDPVDTNVSISLSGAGRSTAEWKTVAMQEGVLQLLRFRFNMDENESNTWLLFRLLPAVWFDALKP